jgi:hypothetical protein
MWSLNYIIFRNAKNFKNYFFLKNNGFLGKENQESFEIFWNCLFSKMESSKLIN